MLGTALYYPHIDIHDSEWLKSAILYWDEIRTIAPRAVKNPYRSEDTKILWKEGFLEPLRCDLHPELLDTLGKRVVTLMDQDSFRSSRPHQGEDDPNKQTMVHADKVGMEMRRRFNRAHIHPEKLSPELRDLAMRAGLARVHPEKLSPMARTLLRELEFVGMHPDKLAPNLRHLVMHAEHFQDEDGEWLLVNGDFAGTYMSALAALLAKEIDIAALTNEEPSMAVNLHTLLEDVKPSAPTSSKGALVSIIMEAIRIDPATRVDKLLKFRRLRAAQLAELSAQFEDLSAKISNCETERELFEKARNVYVKRVRPRLEALKDELKDSSVQAVWEGVQRAVTVSVPAGGALAYFSGLSGTTLLAAGAAIAVADLAVKSHLARKKTRRASPYTYLFDIERKFSVKA